MSDLISIGIRLAAALAVCAFVYWVYHEIDSSLESHYADPVRVEYQKKVDAEHALRTSAEAANVGLQGQMATVKKDVLACNQSVRDLTSVSQTAVNASKAALKSADDREAKYQGKIQGLEAQARSQNTQGDFCDKARKGYDILNDLSRDLRVREPGK